MKHLISIWTLLLLALPIRAVETILLGNVHDGPTGSPLANVQIYFRGTKVGTTTDSTGFFFLRVDMQQKAKLVVKMLGYKKQEYDILPGQSAGMEVFLEEKINALAEVTALPSDEDAFRLMQAARQNKAANAALSSKPLPAHTHYYLSDIRPKLLERKMWQRYASQMLLQSDSSYLMPLPDEGYKQFVLPLPEHLSFYDNTLSLGEVSLLSPLAGSGNAFYRYGLLDSTVVQYGPLREKHYRIRFVPRNPFNPTLEGALELDSATYALRRVQAVIPRETNINYLTGLHYNASYAPNGQLLDEHLSAIWEVNAKRDTSHLFPSLLAVRDAATSQPVTLPDTLVGADSTANRYLAERLAEPVVLPSDSVRLAIQDDLTQRPFFRFARWVGYTAYTGYIPTGTWLEVGNITDIFKYTAVEHLHLGLPFRTGEALWKHVSLGAYIGYGWRDRGIKYKAELQATLPTPMRHLVGVAVSDNYVYSEVSPIEQFKNENGISHSDLLFTSYILNGVSYASRGFQTEARRRECRLYSENEWLRGNGAIPGIETFLSAQIGHQGYDDPLAYSRYADLPSYRYASMRAILRLGWHEKNTDFYMLRRRRYSRYPTLWVATEVGSYHLDKAESYQTYGKFDLMLRHDVNLGVAGRLHYIAQAGIVLGAVPYTLLEIFNGNRGVTYSPDRFTLMNNYQYAADRYLALQMHYDGRGVLFNQIPGIRYLRLHELLEAKLAWGGLSNKHQQVLDFPRWNGSTTLAAPHIPYVELGCGLGNILGVGELMFVWRLTNRNDISADKWGVRFRIHLGL